MPIADAISSSVPVPAAGLNLRNILVTTDFTAPSTLALRLAAGLCRQHHALLHLAHFGGVPPLQMIAGGNIDPLLEEVRRESSQQMALLDHANYLYGVEHLTHLEEGVIPAGLPQKLQAWAIDLLVLATHGRTGWRKLAVGSVAEAVLESAACPVLAIGPEYHREPVAPLRRVLFATDFHAAAGAELACAAQWADHTTDAGSGRLAVLHVLHESWRDAHDAAARAACVRNAEVQLRGLANPRGETAACLVDFGPTAATIVKWARAEDSDLIVVGRGSGHAATAYHVLCEAPCAVLVLPRA